MEKSIFINQPNPKSELNFNFRKFYPYHSKPKVVLVIKKIIGVFSAIGLLLFFGAGLGAIIAESSAQKEPYVKILKDSIWILYPFITLYVVYRSLQKYNYDSQKYSASVVYAILIIAYNSFWIYQLVGNQTTIKAGNTASFSIWMVFNLINIVLIVAIIALFFILIITRPKIDPDRVKKIQKEIQKKATANLAGEEYEINLTDLE